MPKTVQVIKYLAIFTFVIAAIILGVYIWAISPVEQVGFFKGVLDGVYNQAANNGFDQYSSKAAGHLSSAPIMLICASSIVLWNISKPSKALLIASFVFVCLAILVSFSPPMLVILCLLFPKSSREFLVKGKVD